MNETIRIYHAGFDIIESPDITRGRANADFGQGFYVSPNEEFSRRWAKHRKGEKTYINTYELDLKDLKIKRFQRDEEWFSYIYDNRYHKDDTNKDYDLIIGPIANDTIYDTFGIITSGILSKEDAMKLLMIGNVYEQIVLKSEKAVSHLRFLSYEEISEDEIASYREILSKEQEDYQKRFVALLKTF